MLQLLTNPCPFKPAPDLYVLACVPIEQTIIRPDHAKDGIPMKLYVWAAPSNAFADIGDRVHLNPYASPTPIKLHNQQCLIVHKNDVLGVLLDETADGL